MKENVKATVENKRKEEQDKLDLEYQQLEAEKKAKMIKNKSVHNITEDNLRFKYEKIQMEKQKRLLDAKIK